MIKSKKAIIAAVLVAAILCALCIPASAETIGASLMKLAKTEGTVAVIDKNSRSVSLFKGMKLQSGYEIATSAASYAWINLDNSKLVKLDALTNVGVEQNGKNLTLTLNSGRILVDVSQKLAADETLNIKTGNVITGVRGTLFSVSAEDPYFESTNKVEIVVYEGKVGATVINTTNGTTKEIAVPQSNKADFTINNLNNTVKSEVLKATGSDVYGFVATEFALNNAMRNRALAGSPDIVLPGLAGSLSRLTNDVAKQAEYINMLAALRNKGINEAIYYKVGLRMDIFGQTSDGQYISGMNPNTGAAQYVWDPAVSGSGSGAGNAGPSSGAGMGASNDPSDAGNANSTPTRTTSSSSPGAAGGAGGPGGEFD